MVRLPNAFGVCEDQFVPFMLDVPESDCYYPALDLRSQCQMQDANYQPAFQTTGTLDYSAIGAQAFTKDLFFDSAS